VLIVASILLAFGIQAWWERRQDAELEQVYLEQLRSDALHAEEQLSASAALAEIAAQSVLMVLAAAVADQPPPSDSIAAWLDQAGAIPAAFPTFATAQGLASSDGLQVIRSQNLRRALVDLLDRLRQLELRLVSYEERMQDAWERMNHILPALERGKPRRVGLFGNPPDSLTRQTNVSLLFLPDLRPMLTDREFMAAVDDLYQARENFRFLVQGMLEETRSFLVALDVPS